MLDYPILDSGTDVNIVSVWQIQANLWKFLILNITYFPDPSFQNSFGKAIYQKLSVLKSELLYENIYLR